MSHFAEGLHEMFISFVKEYDSSNGKFKDDMIHVYLALRELINNFEKLQQLKSN